MLQAIFSDLEVIAAVVSIPHPVGLVKCKAPVGMLSSENFGSFVLKRGLRLMEKV